MNKSRLRKAQLQQVDFSDANLLEVDFTNADLTGANIRRAQLHKARLLNTLMIGVQGEEASCNEIQGVAVDFTNANLPNVWFAGAN